MNKEQNFKLIKGDILKIRSFSLPYLQDLQFPPLKVSTLNSFLCFLLEIFYSAFY